MTTLNNTPIFSSISSLISNHNLNPLHFPTLTSIYLYIHINNQTYYLYNPHYKTLNTFSSLPQLLTHISTNYKNQHTYLTPTHPTFNSLISLLQYDQSLIYYSHRYNINTIHTTQLNQYDDNEFSYSPITPIHNETSTSNITFQSTPNTITIYLKQLSTHTTFINQLLSLL